MDWMLPELINTLSRDIKVTPVSHGDHNLAQQRLGVECMWWIARAKKSGLIRRHDTVRKVNPNWKKCLSILTTPVAWFTAWTCAFENRAGVNQWTWMPHRWILGLHGSIIWFPCLLESQQRNKGKFVSTMTLNCFHQILLWTCNM